MCAIEHSATVFVQVVGSAQYRGCASLKVAKDRNIKARHADIRGSTLLKA